MRRFFLFVTLALTLAWAQPVRADVAPPEMPPGVTLLPGEEMTQVRMEAETVTLNIVPDPADAQGAIAQTQAVFNMKNLGQTSETMLARFPLTFFNGNSDGFGNFPEIADLTVKVNGQPVNTRREMQPYFPNQFSYPESEEIPWAVFPVTFPPGEAVTVDVRYSVEGYGYFPYEIFRYVLETGAGWNGTIGLAQVIVHFPYPVTDENVWMVNTEDAGFGNPTPGFTLQGQEMRWRFDNLEPDASSNIELMIVSPSLWQTALKEEQNVAKNPRDGEAWGRLGKTYKEIIRMSKGYLRTDAVGRAMFEKSRAAYEQCLQLLPQDSLWHYGYADLLWSKYLFEVYYGALPDSQGLLPLTLSHLQAALEIDPKNERALELLNWVESAVPEAVHERDGKTIYLALTATPLPPTPWSAPTEMQPTAAPIFSSPTPTALPAASALPAVTPAPTALPAAEGNFPCASAALLPLLLGFLRFRRQGKR